MLAYAETEAEQQELDMNWAVPQHTKGKVDWAGRILIDPDQDPWGEEWYEAIDIISNWRSSLIISR